MSPSAEDEPLKAVVFADHCGLQVRISDEPPPSLSVHGVPLLHWQLHVLARGGVAEAVVLSSAPLDVALPSKMMSMIITCIHNPTWRSPGDAIRDIDARVDVRPRHDFVIVQPGAIFNVDVGSAARAHKARCKVNRNWLVSIVLRNGVSFKPRAVAIDDTTGGICFFKEDARDMRDIVLDTKSENVGLQNGGRVTIYTDFVDIGLDICSPDFLVEFRENFDFDSVRDFIRAKLDGGEAELLGNKMYAHFVDSKAGEYAARLETYKAYMAVVQDIFDGWMLPVTPLSVLRSSSRPLLYDGGQNVTEICDLDSNSSSQGGRRPVYCRESNSRWHDVVVGKGAAVDRTAVLKRCIIEENVQIGAHTLVEGSIVGRGSVIGEHVTICESLLLNDCFVADRVFVPSGSFLHSNASFRVESRDGSAISVDYCVPPVNETAGRSCENTSSGMGMFDMSSLNDSAVLAQQDDTQQLRISADSVSEGHETDRGMLRNTECSTWPKFMTWIDSGEEDEFEDGTDSVSGSEVDSDLGCRPSSGLEKFNDEVFETLSKCDAENVDVETAALEVNSLKLAYEKSFFDAEIAVLQSLAEIAQKAHISRGLAVPHAVLELFGRWNGLIKRFSGGNSTDEQQRLVETLAEHFSPNGRLLRYVLHALYDSDVLEEDAILGWVNFARSDVNNDKKKSQLLNEMHDFIEWLENADEEQESGSESAQDTSNDGDEDE